MLKYKISFSTLFYFSPTHAPQGYIDQQQQQQQQQSTSQQQPEMLVFS
jgi:hypothetical protein